MNKEQVFSLLKDSILIVKNREKELKINKNLQQAFLRQNELIKSGMETLSKEDKELLEKEYSKWYQEVFLK